MTVIVIVLTLLLVGSLFSNYLILHSLRSIDNDSSMYSQTDRYRLKMDQEGSSENKSPDRDKRLDGGETMAVAFHGNMAYWITDEGLMTAPATKDSGVSHEDAKLVDTLSMSNRQISVLMEIIDTLRKER